MKPETWIIVHKETGEQWVSKSGKSSWRKSAHAKLAWANHHYDGYKPLVSAALNEYGTTRVWDLPRSVRDSLNRFDSQSDYELKEIGQPYVNELLQRIESMEAMIKSEDWKRLKEFVCG